MTETTEPTTTTVEVCYRDASNYKQHRQYVFAGVVTPEQEALITGNLSDDGFFLPAQVGLEPLYSMWASHYEDDHVWHELELVAGTSSPTADGTIGEFAERFRDVTWDVVAANADLEAFKESTPVGK